MAQHVTSEQYYDLSGQLREIDRQLRQQNGYPFDLVQLKMHLQKAIEGKFEVAPTAIVVEKFELLVNLGVITVPEGHVSNTVFCGKNFSDPSRVLKPGDKLRVEAYRQIVSDLTTSRERRVFLERLEGGNVYLGAQGIELVIAQKISQLPENYWYVSFDGKENLSEGSVGSGWVSIADVGSDGNFHRRLGYLGLGWHDYHAFLRFSDFVESP